MMKFDMGKNKGLTCILVQKLSYVILGWENEKDWREKGLVVKQNTTKHQTVMYIKNVTQLKTNKTPLLDFQAAFVHRRLVSKSVHGSPHWSG